MSNMKHFLADLEGPKSLLSDTTDSLRHQTSAVAQKFRAEAEAVAKVSKLGGPAAARRQKMEYEREIAKLGRERDMMGALCEVLDQQPQMIVGDASGFVSKHVTKSIRNDKVIWAEVPGYFELADKITLAQKFKISSDIPNIDELSNFGKELRKENILQMQFEHMWIEYKMKIGSQVVQFAIFAENWECYSFINYTSRWFCIKPQGNCEPEFTAFLVLFASASTLVTPCDGEGRAMRAVDGAPTFSHHLVRLNVPRYDSEGLGGHHAPPRLHWRRGHIRRQRFGRGRGQIKKIWIAPMLVGSADRGIVTHDYQL